MLSEFRANRHVVYACTYHVVWCPKYRRPVLTGPVEARLKDLIRLTVAETQGELVELEVMPDHVHLLVSVDPQFGIHRLIKRIKGVTSRLLRTEFPAIKRRLPTLWTHSYFVATCGGAPLELIKQYVANQKHA